MAFGAWGLGAQAAERRAADDFIIAARRYLKMGLGADCIKGHAEKAGRRVMGELKRIKQPIVFAGLMPDSTHKTLLPSG